MRGSEGRGPGDIMKSHGADMQQRSAHENPVIFYSMAIGFLGKSTIQLLDLDLFQLDIARAVTQLCRVMRYHGGLPGYDGITTDNIGPTMVLTVPPIRKSFGWKPAERIPTTFPRMSKSP
jgi:hypothetical protein